MESEIRVDKKKLNDLTGGKPCVLFVVEGDGGHVVAKDINTHRMTVVLLSIAEFLLKELTKNEQTIPLAALSGVLSNLAEQAAELAVELAPEETKQTILKMMKDQLQEEGGAE